MFKEIIRAVVWTLPALILPAPAAAQGLETLGSRAAALAAFVAVADDASAVAWNPSGLVSGPFFNVQLDLGRSTKQPKTDPQQSAMAAARTGSVLVAIGTTPLGLAYYRLTATSLRVFSPAVVGTPNRQNSQLRVRTLVTSHLGATVQQSLGEFLTLGATVKLVRGSVGVASVTADSWNDAFDLAEATERQGSTRGDVDLGAMFAAGQVRAGLVVRNVTAPSFGEEDTAAGRQTLERHARVGFAWADRWPGISATVLSVDADLTRVETVTGDRRDIAAGVERWLLAQRVGVRGGVRTSTIGDARPVVSAGGSYAVRPGVYVDVFVARGTDDERVWGVAARMTY
jgi:hypothetical protein